MWPSLEVLSWSHGAVQLKTVTNTRKYGMGSGVEQKLIIAVKLGGLAASQTPFLLPEPQRRGAQARMVQRAMGNKSQWLAT